MLDKKTILGLSIGAGIVLASLFFAVQRELIIFNWRQAIVPASQDLANSHKQIVKIYFWKNQHWNFEKTEILWGNQLNNNLTSLTQAWLNQLEEEGLIKHKITLQSVLLNANGQIAYLSFDQSLFRKQHSTAQKLYLIESLGKTWRENGIKVPQVQLLLRHKIYPDHHLDFSTPWPVNGFLT